MASAEMKTMVRNGETPEMLSARCGVPICMLLRANRLVCATWLLPGREIIIPKADFCENDAFPCPAGLFDTAARDEQMEICVADAMDTIASFSRAMGTTERLVLLNRGKEGPLREGERILLKKNICKKRIRSVLPGDTLTAFCMRHKNADAEALARLNRIEDSRIWPGMRVILPDGGGV